MGDTPRTPRDNLRTSPGLEDLEDELDAPLLRRSGQPPPGEPPALYMPATAEAKRILAIGVPMVAEEVLSYGSTLISLAMAGRLGGFALGAFALSHAVTNITGIALLNGLTGAMDTFGSQAYGSRTYPAVGIVLQKALALSLAACAPLMALYWFIEPVLLLLGQDAALAAAAARYTRIYAPKVPLHAVVCCLYRALAAMGAARHVLAAGAVFFVVTAPINWALIWGLGWGLDGSAAASVACEAVYAAALLAACASHNARRAPGQRWWGGWDGAALRDWGPFLRLSLSATLMICLDWWLYDVLTLLAGLLPHPDVPVAASGIVYNIQTIVFMMPFGLAFAVCARVGQRLGAGHPRAAKVSAEVGTALGLVTAGLPALALLLSGERAAAVFTRDAAVIRACAALMLPLATLMITNGVTAMLSGIMRGCGRQKAGAWVNGLTNYAVGLPLQLLFAFRLRGGVTGLWWGLAAAAALQALVLAALVSRFDWRQEADRADVLVRHLSQSSSVAAAASQPQQPPPSSGLPSPEVAAAPPLF